MTKTRDEIGGEVTRAINGGDSRLNLRAVCKDYDEDDLHIALDYISGTQTTYIEVVMEAIAKLRHKEVKEHFEDLKKPSWIDKWTLGLVIVSTFIGLLALVVAFISLVHELRSTANTAPLRSSMLPTQQISVLPPATTHTNLVAAPASPKK